MLQADELIQQKEWQQLSADEKAMLSELAGNEAEFNLLKKMLQVSAEEVSEVPPLNPAVYHEIKAMLPVVKKASGPKYWYAAAAAILVMAIAAFFIFKKETKVEYVKMPGAPVHNNPGIKEEQVIKKDSVPVMVNKEKIISPSKKITQKPSPVYPSLNEDPPLQNNYAVLDASVAGNAALLDLIGEVE